MQVLALADRSLEGDHLTSDGHVVPSASPDAQRQPSACALTLVVSEMCKHPLKPVMKIHVSSSFHHFYSCISHLLYLLSINNLHRRCQIAVQDVLVLGN